MEGKGLDAALAAVYVAAVLSIATTVAGAATLLVAVGGGLLLGWYNVLIRHDPASGSLRAPWARPVANHPQHRRDNT
jgi:hypothetical protein